MRSRALTAVLFVLAAAILTAAGSVSVTRTVDSVGVQKVSLGWTANGSGFVASNTFAVPTGELLQVKFVPASGGSQPTDLYDVTLVDQDGVDYLAGLGANLSNTAPSIVVPRASTSAARFYVDGSQAWDLLVTAAGASKSGTVVLWIGR